MASVKSVSKTIRLTQEDYDYIMSFKGSSFNEKLDNLLKLMYRDVPELEAKVASLRDLYSRSWQDLSRLDSQIRSFRDCVRGLEYLQGSFENVSNKLSASFPEEVRQK